MKPYHLYVVAALLVASFYAPNGYKAYKEYTIQQEWQAGAAQREVIRKADQQARIIEQARLEEEQAQRNLALAVRLAVWQQEQEAFFSKCCSKGREQ
jgi:hypothetical protein